MPKVIRRIGVIFHSFAATLLCLLLYPFKNAKLDDGDPEKPAVLLVHGWIHNETGWFFYRRHLKKAGLGAIHTVCYRSVRWDIPQNSQIIKERLEQIQREKGQEVRILIGHSQGGLECLEYALEYAPKDRLTYVITLGSPLHGTRMTPLGFGPSVRQMVIHSPYLETLHQRLAKATHLRVLSLAGDADLITLPRDSAHLVELSYATNEMIEDLGHMGFLFSKKPIQRIINYLQKMQLI